MNTNLLATIYSFIYILAIIAVAFVLYRFTKIGSEGVRKFIHILVTGWVLILVNCYDSLAWAVIGPVTFIFLNAAFVYSGFSKCRMYEISLTEAFVPLSISFAL